MAGGNKNYLVNINLNKNELQNAKVQNLAVAPSGPTAGQIYFDTVDDTIYFWDGTQWVGTGGDITSVSGDAPIQAITTGLGDVTISIDPATSGVTGSMPGSDKTKLDAATSNNTPNTLVLRDGNGDFSANDITVNDVDASTGTIDSLISTTASITDGTITTLNSTTGTIDDLTSVTASITDLTSDDVHVSGTLGSNTAVITATSGTVNQLTINDAPVIGTDAVNKAYVDALSSGLDPKESVTISTVLNIATASFGDETAIENSLDLVGAATFSLATDDRVLVKNQTDATYNGIYVWDGANLVRSEDHDGSPASEVSGGNFTFVENGDVHANSGWVLQGDGILTLGVDDIDWVQFSGAGQITAGAGMIKTGEVLDVELDSNSGLQFDVGGPTGKLRISSTIDGTGLSQATGVLSVDYGSSAGSAVEGNTSYSFTAGSGLSGTSLSGSIGSGISPTFNVNLGTGLTFSGDDIITDSSLSLITGDLPTVMTATGSSIQQALEDLDSQIGSLVAGSITEVVAGAGLTGGGNTGAVTVDITSPNSTINVSVDGIDVTYGNTANTAIEGNTTYTLTAGSGLTGSSSGNVADGVTATFDVNLGTGLALDGDHIISDSDLVLITATLSGVGTTDGSSIQTALEDLDTAISDITGSDIEEVVAGAGLTGGGTQGQVTLDVQATNGIEVVGDFVQINDDTVAGNGLTASNGVIGIDNTAPGTLRHTSTGHIFNNTFGTFNISHNLGTNFLQVIAYDQATGDDVTLDVDRIDANTVQIGGRANPSITVDVIILG